MVLTKWPHGGSAGETVGGRGGGESWSRTGVASEGDESGNRARSPHYFVQITHAAVICEIPVILHFKLENKTASLAVAYPSGGISMLSPTVTLTLLQASRARVL